MPTVEFVPDGKKVDADNNARLQDVCENNGIGLPFACKDGQCATCLITVEEGMENLTPKTDAEKETLPAAGATEKQRLACQCSLKGNVKLNY